MQQKLYNRIAKEYWGYKTEKANIRTKIKELEAELSIIDDTITMLYGILSDYGDYRSEQWIGREESEASNADRG